MIQPNQWDNIPRELRELPQWCYSDLTADTPKQPLNSKTGFPAKVNDPNSWHTFEEACAAALQCGKGVVGMMLTKESGYVFIDLDNKADNPATQEELDTFNSITNLFPSYSEKSTSGLGAHIVVRGTLPNKGIRRGKVELYSSGRYMICTGDAFGDVKEIGAFPNEVTDLVHTMGGGNIKDDVEALDYEETLTDTEIVEMAMAAPNADQFNLLCQGDWAAAGHTSNSEGRLTLLNHLAFYSRNNEQVKRLLAMSGFWNADADRLFGREVNLARDMQVPLVPIDEVLANAQAQHTEPKLKHIKQSFPPGLVGEIAQYIYDTAQRPFEEIAVGAAISLAAGILGRSFDMNGSGLNHYVIVLAGTGRGKEAGKKGVLRIMAEVQKRVLSANAYIGPGEFASGQALMKEVVKNPCFLSILGEFGLTLQSMCHPKAPSHLVTYRKALLNLYSLSGPTDVAGAMSYSNKEDNVASVRAPNFTFLAESTHDKFFEGLTDTHISEGLIPRLTVLSYDGKRMPTNGNAGAPPSDELVTKVEGLFGAAIAVTLNDSHSAIHMTDAAQKMLDAFDVSADNNINASKGGVSVEVWNRAHLKALKLAGLVAAADNTHDPVVTEEHARWAIDFVRNEITYMLSQFNIGVFDGIEDKTVKEVRRLFKKWATLTPKKRKANKGRLELVNEKFVMQHEALAYQAFRLTAFKKQDQFGMGKVKALENAIQILINEGSLMELDKLEVLRKFGVANVCYALV